MNTTSMYGGLPSWAKGAIAMAGIAAVGLIGWKIYAVIQKRMATSKERETQTEVNKELKDLSKQGIKPTLSNAQLSIMADQLKIAFDGYGSDVSTVNRIFAQIKNEADMLLLLKIYGIREISSGAWSPAPNANLSLVQALTDELSGSEMGKLTQTLAKKGIKISL